MTQGDVWEIESLLEGKTIEENLDLIEKKVDEFTKIKEELKPDLSPKRLLEIVQEKEKISVLFSKVGLYVHLKQTENTTDTSMLAKISVLSQRGTDMGNKTKFFTLWFIGLEDKEADKFIEAPELKDYKYFLELLRKEKPHTLSEEIEKVISLKSMTGSGASSQLYDTFTNQFLWDFDGKKELTQEQMKSYWTQKDPKKREESYKLVYGKYKDNSLVLSEIYKNIVIDWLNEGIKIRKYETPMSIENADNDITDKAVDALLNTIRKNSKLFQEYFKLKYEMNKKKGGDYTYSRYHIYAPYEAKVDKKYTYEESKKFMLEMLEKFDSRFHDAAKKVLDLKHVHSHPKKFKRSGAFMHFGAGPGLYPYVMLNHDNEFRDLSTMFHEFGHAIHDVFSMENVQTLRHAVTPMCETASIFNEMLLNDKMLEDVKDDEEKKALLIEMLDQEYGTIIRQAYFIVFEKDAHEMIKNGATKDELDEKYHENLKEQFGDMEIPDVYKHEWNFIPHIHHSPFYCYSYAWGNLMVLALYGMYKDEGKPFIEKYIKILSAGGSKSPADILRDVGIDPESEEFWQKGFDMIQKQLEQLKEVSKEL